MSPLFPLVHVLRIAVAVAVLGPLAGCDVLEDFLSQPTAEEASATASLVESATGCASVRVQIASLSGANTGGLTANDCFLDDAYADFWLFKAASSADVSATVTASAFSPDFSLYFVDLGSSRLSVVESGVPAGDGQATLEVSLAAGLHLIAVTSTESRRTGSYTLRVTRR